MNTSSGCTGSSAICRQQRRWWMGKWNSSYWSHSTGPRRHWRITGSDGRSKRYSALKSSGFNIEDTHVTALDRLEKLIMLTMVAFIWCYRIGDYIDEDI